MKRLTLALALLALPRPLLAAATAEAFVTMSPCRAVDTRGPAGPLGGPALGANETRILTITGSCGVPTSALGLAVNVTVVDPAAAGYAQLYAGDAAAPVAQVLSFSAGQTRASNTLVALASDASGTIALANVSGGPADFIIDISGYFVTACVNTITVTNPSTASGAINAPFSQTFTQTGGTGTTTFSTASPLPAGLTLAANGVLSGTPTQPGTFPITVTATDANGCTGTGPTYSLVITCQTISVTNPATTTGTANAPFSQTFTQTGGVGTTTFATSSPLPIGLTLAANGLLSGTPTQAGGFPIVVTATDANGCTGAGATYNLVINCQAISVTNPAVTGGTAGQAFSQTFTQSGAIGTATFTTASTLPAGLTLAANGVLSGTPTQTGTFPIVVTVTDGNLCTGVGATYNLVIGCGTIAVSNPATTTATVGTAFSQTFTQAGAIGTATFTTVSTLPTGLTLAVNGVLSGTPTQFGTFPIVVTVTDANGCTGTGATYNLVVSCQSIIVGPATLPQGTTGVAYPDITFTQTGAVGSVIFAQTGTLPTGMNFLVDTLSGTPTQTGSFPITVTATDSNGCTASRDYLLVVACSGTSITLSPSSLPTVLAGSAFPTTTFTASGGTGPYTFSQAGALPTGMTFLVDTLSGTPTQTGTFPITISATDNVGGCAGSQDYVITVTCAGVSIIVAPASLSSGNVGTPYPAVTFTATGGAGTYTFAETGALPAGMSFTVDTLSGTPTQGGTFPITVTATDVAGCTGATAYSLVIVCPTITVTNPSTTTGTVDAAFSQAFTQTGASGTATFTTTSTLPTGLTLATDGTLSGTPGQNGTFPITVTVTDSNGCTGTSAVYTLVIACQTITVTNPATATGTVDSAFSQTFTQTGVGTHTPATFTTASTLPSGLTLSTAGVLSGTPGEPGTYPIVVTVTDANGCTGTSSTYNLVIACQTITVTNPVVTAGTYNTAFSQTFTQTGVGTHTPATFTTASTLPTGLSLSTAGVLSGTPLQTGAFPIVVTVTDANGCTGTGATYTLSIGPKLTAKAYTDVGNTQLAGGVVAPSTPSVSVVAVSNGDTSDVAITYAVTVAPTNGALTTFNSNGTFLYTPNAGNTTSDAFTYTGTSNGVSATQTATIAFNGLVWYVDSAAGGSHDGRSNTPFSNMGSGAGNLGSVTTSNGDFIYVLKGGPTTSGAYTMKPSQQLIGAGATLNVPTVSPILTVAGSAANTPTLSGTLTLASSVTVNGIDMSTGSSNALVNTTAAVTGINVTPRDVSTSTGAAVNVNPSSGTATGTMTFHSINASGGANGIVLQNFNGTFTVNGDGTGHANGSGGSISNATTEAVHMQTAAGTVTLKSMNFSLNTSAIDGMLVDNNAGGTLTVNVIGCTYSGVTASVNQNKSLLQFEGGGTANVTANVQSSFFNGSRTYGFFATGAGTSIMNVTLNQCGFGTDVNTGAPVSNPGTVITNPPAFAVGITNGSGAQVDYVVNGNTFWGADGLLGAVYAVTVSGASTTGGSHLNGSFTNNKIGKTGVVGSGCSNGCGGLGLLPGTSGQFKATVTNNDIRQVNALGMQVFNSAGGGATISVTAKIKGNTFDEPDTTGSPLFLRAIIVSPGNSGGASVPTCAEIGGALAGEPNVINGAWQAGNFIRVTNNNNTQPIVLPGLAPASGATAAQVNAFVQANNTMAAASVNSTLGTAGINGGSPCP